MKLFSWHMLPWRPWMDLREMRRYLSILLICHNRLFVEFFSYRHFCLSFLAEPSRKQVSFTWRKVTSPKLLVLWGRVDWIQERYILMSLSDFAVCLPYSGPRMYQGCVYGDTFLNSRHGWNGTSMVNKQPLDLNQGPALRSGALDLFQSRALSVWVWCKKLVFPGVSCMNSVSHVTVTSGLNVTSYVKVSKFKQWDSRGKKTAKPSVTKWGKLCLGKFCAKLHLPFNSWIF